MGKQGAADVQDAVSGLAHRTLKMGGWGVVPGPEKPRTPEQLALPYLLSVVKLLSPQSAYKFSV